MSVVVLYHPFTSVLVNHLLGLDFIECIDPKGGNEVANVESLAEEEGDIRIDHFLSMEKLGKIELVYSSLSFAFSRAVAF